jgi:hypothetical protein
MIMETNAGTRTCTKQATVPGLGTVWYNKHAIANIFSFSQLLEDHRITYDSDIEDVFVVQHKTTNVTIKFWRGKQGLYACTIESLIIMKKSNPTTKALNLI